MAFENRTIKEVRDLLIAAFQQEFNGVLRMLPRSFIKIFATIIAGIFIVLYKQIGWFFLQIFPETAYWGEVKILGFTIRPLLKWGELIGVGLPYSGTQWRGKIEVDVTNCNSSMKPSVQLKSDLTGKIYLTTKANILMNNKEIIDIVCNVAGTSGNLVIGDTLNFVSPLGNVEKKATVVSIINDATNDETEADYRYRVVNRYRMQPQGGSLADYRIWAADVPGVLNTYPYNDAESPAGVLLYVSGKPTLYPDRIPSAALLVQVGDSCTYHPETGRANRKPLTAIIDPDNDGTYKNVRPITIIEFNVAINGLSGIAQDEFAELVRPAIEDYFLGREPYIRGLSDDNNKTNNVSRNNVASVVDQTALSVKAEFELVKMYRNGKEESLYTLGMGELAKLGILYVDGAEF